MGEVRRFLEICVFFKISFCLYYRIIAHIVELLYDLLRKRVKFAWTNRHSKIMTRLKNTLISPPILRSISYSNDKNVIMIIDSNLLAIRWAIE